MRLVFIRHAESAHSIQGIIAGTKGCAGLTTQGFAQAQNLANRLSTTGELQGCQVLLSSPVKRARQTAEVLQSVLSVKEVVEDENLCELHPGDADGLTRDVYHTRYGTYDLLAEPDRAFAPGGESWNTFLERVRVTLEQLKNRYKDQDVVAVSHAGFIMATLLVLFDIPRPGTGTWLEPSNTAMTEWQVIGNTWTLVHYNDSLHLMHSNLFKL